MTSLHGRYCWKAEGLLCETIGQRIDVINSKMAPRGNSKSDNLICLLLLLNVATHEGTSRGDRSQGPVPGTNSHRVNRPIFVKNPAAGTEFWSPKSVPRIQTGLNSLV